jgi:hypothetical protein
MNSLYSCSWVKNTTLLKENSDKFDLLVESQISTILKSVVRKMSAAGVGTAYRDSRLFFYSFLRDMYPELVPDDFKERYENVKPSAAAVNALVGHIVTNEKLPKDFAEKLGDEFHDYTEKEIKVGDKKIDNLTFFLTMLSSFRDKPKNPKNKPKPTQQEIISRIKAGKPESSFKKGDNAYETLTLNLSPDENLTFAEQGMGDSTVYTVQKGDLKYRVTLKSFEGDEIQVSDISPDNIASLVVTKPTETRKVEGPQIGEPSFVDVEKPVADYPPFSDSDLDFSGPDPSELAYGGMRAKEELYGDNDYDEPEAAPTSSVVSPDDEIDFGDEPSKPVAAPTPSISPDDELSFDDEPSTPVVKPTPAADDLSLDFDDEPTTKEEPESESELVPPGNYSEPDEPGEADVEKPEKIKSKRDEMIKKKIGYWERLKRDNPELYKKAWAKRQAALSGEEYIEPGEEDVGSSKSMKNDEEDEEKDFDFQDRLPFYKRMLPHSYDDEDTGDEDPEEKKKSSKQKDKEVKEAYRQRIQRYHTFERRNTLGY